MTDLRKPIALFATTAVAAFVFAAGPALAVGAEPPTETPLPSATDNPVDKKATDTKAPDAKPADAKPADAKPADAKPADAKSGEQKPEELKEKSDKKSERRLPDGYRYAYDLIYRQHDYARAIAALHAIGHDEHPDVANLVGFASRKLGNYHDAKVWYEKALVSDPGHTRTWQYYGLWHLEQGNRLKAEEHLEKIRLICGLDCEDFRSLKKALDGKVTY